MNFPFFFAKKVQRTAVTSFTRQIMRIASFTVALSLMVMIIAASTITGFQKQISRKIFDFWGHIQVSPAAMGNEIEMHTISKNQGFLDTLRDIGQIGYDSYREIMGIPITSMPVRKETVGGIKHIQPYLLYPAILKTRDEFDGIVLKGVDTAFYDEFYKNYLQTGQKLIFPADTSDRGILISKQTSDRLKLKPGDPLIIVFAGNGEQKLRRFHVKGIYKTGLEEYDKKFALVDMRDIQAIAGLGPDQISGFEVFLDNLDDLEVLNNYIYTEVLPTDFLCQSVKEKWPAIFDWLQLQDINKVVILGLMLIVCIIIMTTSLLILILERTQTIGLLKALGSPNKQIVRIFLYQATYIIGWGVISGNVAGLALCYIQQKYKIVRLDEALYYLPYAPIQVEPWAVIQLNIICIAVILLFLLIPARLVSAIRPVKALKFE